MKKTLLFFICILLVFTAKSQNYVPDKARNLTVVYFLPKDQTPLADYEARLSKVILYYQQWYGQNMKNYGYVDANGNGKTFGLIKDAAAQRVQIITYNATRNAADYKNGSTDVKKETNDYLIAQGLKSSQHVLVFWVGIPNGPYVGDGTYCFVNDDLRTSMDQAGSGFVSAIGGPAHELGHALNLPHNSGTLSDLANPQTGSALMSTGLYQFTQSPVFLTAADCAILNSNEIFNSENKTYYGNVNLTTTSIYSNYNPTTRVMSVSGKISTDVPVDMFTYFVDPNYENEGVGVNKDYNATTWASKPIGTDSFYIDIPIDELSIKYPYEASGSDPFNYPYEFKIRTVHSNGKVGENIYYFSFNNDAPVTSFGSHANVTVANRAGWTISATPAATIGDPNGPKFVDENKTTGNESALAAIDGSLTTYWRSYGSSSNATDYPHTLIIDTKTVQDFVGWSVQARQVRNANVVSVAISYSNDGVNFSTPVTRAIDDALGVRYAGFGQKVSFRYFKITMLAGDGFPQVATMAEINLYKGPDPVAQSPVVTTRVANNGWTARGGTKTYAAGGTFIDEDAATGDRSAMAAIDGLANTSWVSKNTASASDRGFPHELIIDTKQQQTFTGWGYKQRDNLTRAMKDVQIYVSNDDINYTLVGTYVLEKVQTLRRIAFSNNTSFRYFKLVANSAYDNDSYATIEEILFYNDPNVTLPVNLISFTGKAQGGSVRLNWTTASEQNADRFEVVRLQGETKNVVAKVNAKNTSGQHQYQATDFNPQPGVNYYQLLQYDTDGKLATQSDVITANIMSQGNTLAITSVNGGVVNFNLVAEKADNFTIYVSNILGQKIAVKKVNAQPGNNTFGINCQASGLQLLTAENAGAKTTKKFVAN